MPRDGGEGLPNAGDVGMSSSDLKVLKHGFDAGIGGEESMKRGHLSAKLFTLWTEGYQAGVAERERQARQKN